MPECEAIDIRAYEPNDHGFLAGIAHRLIPDETASPRDSAAMERYFAELPAGRLLAEPGSEAFVASIDDVPLGVVAVHPDVDYFTGHPRAYVDILVVDAAAEGRGVGRALMRHVERWARRRGCREVVLDVFASNAGAIAFYERCGYRPDHFRMAKRLD